MSGEGQESTRHRVFFALWPEPALRCALHRLALELPGGRAVPKGHLHLTLAFAGLVTPEQLTCLKAQADEVRVPTFRLQLQRLAGFRRAGVAHVGPEVQAIPEALMELARQLNQVLAECGVAAERRQFRPHVTLRRKTHPPRVRAVALPEWRVQRFVLVESGDAGRPGGYRLLGEWPLQDESGEGGAGD